MQGITYKIINTLYNVSRNLHFATIGQNMIPRPAYQNLLEQYRDTEHVKVLQGVRRCGKSTLLSMFRDSLLVEGVKSKNIFFKRLDALGEPLDYTAQNLLDEIVDALEHSNRNHMFYVLIDEIQDVERWEKVVRRLHTEPGVDIYLTGSNAHILSSDLATHLAGRTTRIDIYPLSFAEYLDFAAASGGDDPNIDLAFPDFLRYGGMPSLFSFKERTPEVIQRELSSIADTILFNDVAMRVGIRDAALLEKLVNYMFSTSGNLFSTRKVVGALKSSGRKTSAETVENYIAALGQAYFLYPCLQTGIAGKQVLNPLRKFYPVDTGLRNLTIGFAQRDLGAQLENVVFLELLRRGYAVEVGALPASEIDFVAQRYEEREYIQVCASLLDDAVFERELAPLLKLADGFPKTILTLDRARLGTTENGIRVVNLIDWLLEEETI